MPVLSVVIPAYNEEHYLPRCLAALGRQQTRYPYEVVVSDNGSTDRTAAIASAHHVRMVVEPHKGYSRAVKAGIGASRAPWVALIDADTVVPPLWVERIASLFEGNQEVVCVGGPGMFYDGPWYIRQALRILNAVVMRLFIAQPAGFNMAFRASAYKKIAHLVCDTDLQWDRHVVLLLRRLGAVRFTPLLAVSMSSRRWRSLPIVAQEAMKRLVNAASLAVCNRPIFRTFEDYR